MDELRMPGRLLIGNLDCEESWRGGPRRPLAAPALAAAAGAATLLRVLAADGDRLWLPAPVDLDRLDLDRLDLDRLDLDRVDLDRSGPAPLALPNPRLESGPLAGTAAATMPAGVVAWGETEEVAALRRRSAAAGAAVPDAAPPDGRLAEVLWRLPAPSPAVAARVNHRRFAFALAEELGEALPGSRIVASRPDLDAARAALAAGRRGPAVGWVAKAPLSAAGRDRLIHPGGPLDGRAERTVERLLARHGELLFEPWCDRLADFGATGLAVAAAGSGSGGVRAVGLHRQLVTPHGRFRGIEVGRAPLDPPGLRPAERERLLAVLVVAGRELARAGYSGPYGVDAWRHRRPDGGEDFRALGEINARTTFGLVAHALAELSGGPLRLLLGGDRPPGSLSLLRPGPAAGEGGIWLER